jgi:hypothetical protein
MALIGRLSRPNRSAEQSARSSEKQQKLVVFIAQLILPVKNSNQILLANQHE